MSLPSVHISAAAELVGLPHFMQFPLPCVTVVSDISVSKLLSSLNVLLQRFLNVCGAIERVGAVMKPLQVRIPTMLAT